MQFSPSKPPKIKFYTAAACIRLYRCWVIYGSSLWCGLVEGVSFMLFLISVSACQTYQPTVSVSSVCTSQRWKVVREWRDRGETESTSPILCWVCLFVKERQLMKCEIFTFCALSFYLHIQIFSTHLCLSFILFDLYSRCNIWSILQEYVLDIFQLLPE